MFEHRPKLITLRRLIVAGCFALLASCGGSHNTSAADPAAVSVSAAPSGLTATAGDAMVTLKWSARSDATGYNVKRATASGGPYSQLAVPPSSSFTDSSAANGAIYFYVVSALNSAGESANSSGSTMESP